MHEGNEGYPVWSETDRTATVAQLTEIFNNGLYEKRHTSHSAHANPCPSSKAPRLGTQVLELDLGATEERVWTDEPCFLLHHVNSRVCVRCLPGKVMATECTVRVYYLYF